MAVLGGPGDPAARPDLLTHALEMPRAYGEFAALLSSAPLLRCAPQGDGRPVVVLPGFTGNDLSTLALRIALRRLGHDVHGWGLGRNLGPTKQVLGGLDRVVQSLANRHGRPVSLVGWSLGGIFARWLAATRDDCIGRVITLGSPYRLEDPRSSRASWVYRSCGHLHDAADDVAQGGPASQPLQVPTTSVYTRTDGVVPPASCVEPTSRLAERIGVLSSHNGLGHHPLVTYAVADRLALPAGDASHFRPPWFLRHLFELD